jgi:hypothetical protein
MRNFQLPPLKINEDSATGAPLSRGRGAGGEAKNARGSAPVIECPEANDRRKEHGLGRQLGAPLAKAANGCCRIAPLSCRLPERDLTCQVGQHTGISNYDNTLYSTPLGSLWTDNFISFL